MKTFSETLQNLYLNITVNSLSKYNLSRDFLSKICSFSYLNTCKVSRSFSTSNLWKMFNGTRGHLYSEISQKLTGECQGTFFSKTIYVKSLKSLSPKKVQYRYRYSWSCSVKTSTRYCVSQFYLCPEIGPVQACVLLSVLLFSTCVHNLLVQSASFCISWSVYFNLSLRLRYHLSLWECDEC